MKENLSGKLVAFEDSTELGNKSNLIPEKTNRRVFSQQYKLEILSKIEEVRHKRGAIGALLRKEGLFASQVSKWREQASINPEKLVKKRGPKPDPAAEEKKQIAKLEKEKARLQKRLKEAEAVIDIQKKISQLMGIKLNPEDSER